MRECDVCVEKAGRMVKQEATNSFMVDSSRGDYSQVSGSFIIFAPNSIGVTLTSIIVTRVEE